MNPTEQEVVDIPNEIARKSVIFIFTVIFISFDSIIIIMIPRKGLIYFPDFCQVVLERFRHSDVEGEDFRATVFKHMCGTESFPTDFRAKKYRLEKHFLTKVTDGGGDLQDPPPGRLLPDHEEPA